ncbi:MAG: hypothetical protein WD030_07540 [Pirellulales bacterium]
MIDPAFSTDGNIPTSESTDASRNGTISMQSIAMQAEQGDGDPAEARKDIYHVAQTLYNDKTDWVTFFREVLGKEGVVRRNFREVRSLHEFETTDDYSDIQEMLVDLWKKNPGSKGEPEATRVITVRMPESVHEALKTEADERRTSMNKLCISKLLQPIDDKFIPSGRKEKATK